MQASYLHRQDGCLLRFFVARSQTFVMSGNSCDLKQKKYLADLQPSSGSDSSVAAGRIRWINRKKSITLKASVCVCYWLGHAPVELYPHVLRYSSWGSPRGLWTSALISFAFVEQRGKNPFKQHLLKCVAKRYLSIVIRGLVHSLQLSPHKNTFGGRRSHDSEQRQVALIAALPPKPSGV